MNGEYELSTFQTEDERNAQSLHGTLNTVESNASPAQSPELNDIVKWIKSSTGIEGALRNLRSSKMRNDLREIEQALMIRYLIDENFEELNSSQLYELARIFHTKAAVILFMTKDFNSMLIYWKSKEIDYFLNLAVTKKKSVQECKEIYAFTVDFLIQSLCRGHLGLQKDCKHSQESNKIELNQLADSDNLNILQISAESGETECVKILLDLGILGDTPYQPHNAPSLALDKQHYDTLLMLMEGNFTYPPLMDFDKLPIEVQQYVKICEELHEAAISKNIDKVVEIVKQNPNRRHFYNKKNQSVLKIALEKNLFSMYEILLNNDVSFGPHEHFARVFAGLNEGDKTILREIHFRCSKDLPEHHMNVLMMNTSISHDDTETEGKEKLVHRAYSVLNKDPLINPILKIVAASKRFDIIFDFKRDSVYAVDPTAPPEMRGSFYMDGRICVGAKQLLDPATEPETFGTLAHELCHYAMNLTFKNRAKPYLKSDQQTKTEYKEIVKYCKEHRDREGIIRLVYNYEEHLHSAELIVRVPHLLAFYHNQPEKLAELREIYSTLFNYHSVVVIPAINKALPGIKAKADKEIKEKDKKIFNLTILLFLSIGLGIVVTYLVGLYLYEPTYKFDDLSDQDKGKVANSSVEYKNVEVKLSELFAGNLNVLKNLTSGHISKILKGEKLNFVDPQLWYLEERIDLKWETLAKGLRGKFLDSNSTFQGETVELKNFNESCSEAFSAMTSQQIINVLNGSEFLVGKKIESEVEFYIERKFIPEDVKLIMFEHVNGHKNYVGYSYFEEHRRQRTKNKTFQVFYNEFWEQSFDNASQILSQVKQNMYFKGYSFDLNHENYHFLHKNSTEIIEQAVKDKILILSSEAGAGKTITFEQLAIEMKKKFPSRWVSYIDLKDHTKLYKTNENAENVEDLLKEILTLSPEKNEFEVRIFEESFKSGTAVLVWNGFDEISPNYNEYVLKVLKSVHENTENIQLVCTRLLYSDQLSQAFKARTWQLLPFDEQKKQEFLRAYFALQNISSEKVEKSIKNIETIMKQFKYNDKFFYNFETPLLIKLLAEIYENEELFKVQYIYEIFEIFVKKKIEIWLEKSKSLHHTAAELVMKGSLKSILQKYALLSEFGLFSGTTLGLKMRKLQIMQTDIRDFPSEEISRMGILFIYGKNNFEFAHKTLAEFFVAQYFIENIFNFYGDVNEHEAELRLELFYHLSKSYGGTQEIITRFMISFLLMRDMTVDKNFNPTISNLLRTKFKNFLIRMLDTNVSVVFSFLFKFFQKDFEVFEELLRIYEDETFYTAIFNPNHFALILDPTDIERVAQNRPYKLTAYGFSIFIAGKNQKGKNLFGSHFYRLLDLKKNNDAYGIKAFNKVSIWELINQLKSNLTKEENKELFKTALSPKVHLFYDKKFRNSNFSDYENLWTNFEGLLSKPEKQEIIGNALILYLEIYPGDKVGHEKFLFLLLEKAGNYLSKAQIFDMFLTKSILHEAHWDPINIRILWNFLYNHTSMDERRKILLQEDFGDKNFYFWFSYNEFKEEYSSSKYPYYYYDFTPFKIFHRAMIVPNAVTFDFTKELYKDHFNKSEILQIVLNSNDFLYYVVGMSNEVACKKFVTYLEELFEGNKTLWNEFLYRKVKPTDLTVFEMVLDFEGLPWSQPKWFKNIQIFFDAYKTIISKKNESIILL